MDYENDNGIGLICEYLNQQLGFTYTLQKKYLIQARLNRRLVELNLPSYESYLKMIRNTPHELSYFFDLLTTNVTSFFRENYQFQIMERELLPAMLKSVVQTKKVRCWSAGCSSGEEAYTLAMVLREALGEDWNIKVLASDISVRRLQEGMAGVYSEEKLKGVPSLLREKYFEANPKKEGLFRVKPNLRKVVIFRKININQDLGIPNNIQFDFIFCRNVFIYFSQEAREKALNRFHHYLNPNGYLLVGQSEPIHFTNSTKWALIKNCIYQKK